jgi:DNA topoisomerase-1
MADLSGAPPQASRLRKIEVSELTIRRLKHGRGTRLVNGQAAPVSARHRERVDALAIPPAWKDVRISADPWTHIQAVGRDDAGRLQYIYHAEWETVRAAAKDERLQKLVAALPRMRTAIRRDLSEQSDRTALAAAARLVDRLHLRAGHEAYAGEESGRGVATLLKRHVQISGNKIRLTFPGKGKKRIDVSIADRKLVAAISALMQLRGPRLFKIQSAGGWRKMTAMDLNGYLAEISKEAISAKDFRTLYASAFALARLSELPLSKSKTGLRRAISTVAKEISVHLVNTPAIVRKSYIHPRIIADYEAGRWPRSLSPSILRNCSPAESLLCAYLSPGSS